MQALSQQQIASFRAHVRNAREAAFMAPQLLEQMEELSRELERTHRQLDVLRRSIREVSDILGRNPRPRPGGSEERAAIAKLRHIAGTADESVER